MFWRSIRITVDCPIRAGVWSRALRSRRVFEDTTALSRKEFRTSRPGEAAETTVRSGPVGGNVKTCGKDMRESRPGMIFDGAPIGSVTILRRRDHEPPPGGGPVPGCVVDRV
ncbi:hypothetical protein GCM10010260_54580 [Streptomyces filipinensis]|uniref:Uncharacterized protein n=1 Tax=Streptomyces filipinensis TaxID=66887 RepID=A0A918IF32_9ACTN|nr:hypothetical protein GCM10010260_54580 [Streptomyces filipinensis]